MIIIAPNYQRRTGLINKTMIYNNLIIYDDHNWCHFLQRSGTILIHLFFDIRLSDFQTFSTRTFTICSSMSTSLVLGDVIPAEGASEISSARVWDAM